MNEGINKDNYFVGIDLGFGFGAKLGIFKTTEYPLAENSLALASINENYDALVDGLGNKIDELASIVNINISQIAYIGLVCPGMFDEEGAMVGGINAKFLQGKNLKKDLMEKVNIPVAQENDANAGALAEWNVEKKELLYWVLGGGWGGAWVSHNGNIRFPAVASDVENNSLHITNEPGYATPLAKNELEQVFNESRFDFNLFLKNLSAEFDMDVITGPASNLDTIRAESVISGSGIYRIFKSAKENKENAYSHIKDSSTAGKQINDLAIDGDDLAKRIFKLFGKALAMAGEQIIKKAIEDGSDPNIPVFIGGKPSNSMPFFIDYTTEFLNKKEIKNSITQAVIDKKGMNANLIGAVVLARKEFYSR